MSVEERHDAVIDTLRVVLSQGEREYILDMSEMYALIDGTKALKRKIEMLEDMLREIA